MKEELIDLLARVVQVLQINESWMTWNLFLAFIPLVLSIWLFRSQRGKAWAWWLGCLVLFACLPVNQRYIKTLSFFLISKSLSVSPLKLGLFTALVILPLTLWMVQSRSGRKFAWWLGFAGFIAFLPNAPYLLTDVIHLIDDIRTIDSVWIITLIIIPLYILVISAGFEAYVISLINLGYYLQERGKGEWVLGCELIIHGLSAVGIYWGRFLRFNSWDFITQPDHLLTRGVEELLGKQPLVIIMITFIVLAGLHWLAKRVTLSVIAQSRGRMMRNVNRSHGSKAN
jgi:uncharacterized membrane protein